LLLFFEGVLVKIPSVVVKIWIEEKSCWLIDMFFGRVHVFLSWTFSWGNSGIYYWTFEPFRGFSVELVAERIRGIEVCTILTIGHVEVFLCG